MKTVKSLISGDFTVFNICANNKTFPLKNQINLFFIVKSLFISNICCTFAARTQ